MTGFAEVTILLLVALTACFSPMQTVEPPAAPLTATIESAGAPDRCNVVAIFHSTAQHKVVEVQVEAEAGILFTETGQSASEWHSLVLQSEETRKVVIECHLDTTKLNRSGEYVIWARVRLPGATASFAEAHTPLLVAVRADEMPHVLTTASPNDMAFLLPYTAGLQNLEYATDLDSKHMPDHGQLFLKVNGPTLAAPSQYVLSLAPGIQFSPSAESIPGVQLLNPRRIRVDVEAIAPGGARYLIIPLQLEPNCLAGEYSLEVAAVTTGVSWGEIAPIVLELVSDPAQPGYGYGLAFHNRAARALDGAVVADLLGGLPVAEAPATLEPAATPTPTPEPTPLPEPPLTPEPTATLPERDKVEGAPQDNLAWQWDNHITGYGGTLWELWVHYVKPVATIPFRQFETLMPRYNPHYDGQQSLDLTATYSLPVGEPTLIGAEAR